MKNVYFLSDAHLGSLAIPHARMQERRLVRFLDSIKNKAAAIYLLGDMFDFWNEYKNVVPKGYTRFLGKISELTDMGVEVHFFTGNHDLWTYGYLEEECGMIVHHKPQTVEIYDKMLSKKTRLMILGDWIWQFTYAVFDGEHMFMEEYVEGESQP